MTEHEYSLVYKKGNEISKEDMARITNRIACAKRVGELVSLLPEAENELRTDAKAFLAKYNLDADPEEMKFLWLSEHLKERNELLRSETYLKDASEMFFRYWQFVFNKIVFRDTMQKKMCVPSNPRMRAWRERQVARCNGDLGGVNLSFVHTPITFELADGCSVGCEFCGLNAGRLKSLFRYTDENAKLFREVLSVCHEVIGDAAGTGMLYFATEPLDNPDYEKFEDDFFKEFKCIPQITTAVGTRDVDRMLRFIKSVPLKNGSIHRLTVTSLEMAREILEKFPAEEMIYSELIPQYEEAPAFVPFTVVGKEAELKEGEQARDGDPGTICCVDGFRVNFCTRELTVFTPCHMSEKNPKGIAEAKTVVFTDAEDFRNKMQSLIDEYMVVELPGDEILRIYDYFSIKESEHGKGLVSKNGEVLLLDKLPKDAGLETLEVLMEGTYTKREIVKKVSTEKGVAPEKVFWILNQYWKMGLIVDSKFFDK